MNDNKVDLVFIEKKGRSMITNRDISKGEILFVWKPYVLVPYVTYKDNVCANCMFISMNKRIMCRQDCLHVYYCSKKCEEEHWDKYHQYECLFLKKIFALSFNEEVINYNRLVMRVLTQRLQNILEKSNNMSIEDLWISSSHFDKFTIEKKNEFEIIAKILTEYVLIKLIPDSIKNDNEELIDFIRLFLPDSTDAGKVQINNFDQWFVELTHSNSFLTDPVIIDVTKYLLQKMFILICIEEINALFHITFALEGYSSPPQTYAMGIYPSAAFVNHSCSPNLARFPIQENRDHLQIGDVLYFATRSIQKGEEVCYSYLERDYELYQKEEVHPQEIIQSQEKRKERLKDEFFFDCDCIRCSNESKGNRDLSYMNLVEELKCKRMKCKGWFIPSFEKQMYCEACRTSLSS